MRNDGAQRRGCRLSASVRQFEDFAPPEAYADDQRACAPINVAAKTTAKDKPIAFPFQELSALPKDAPDVTVQHIGLGPGTVGAIVGAPNVSKTTLMVWLALCIAFGVAFFGRKTRKGPVAYFAPEAPRSVAMRAHAAMQRHFPDERAPFYLISETPALGAEAWSAVHTARIIATIREISSTEGDNV